MEVLRHLSLLSCLLLVLSSSCCESLADLEELYEGFYEVANLEEVVDLLQEKAEEDDPDMMRIIDYMNSTDFRTINDFMWDFRGSRDVC